MIPSSVFIRQQIDDYLTLDDDDEDAGIESLRSHKLVFSKAKGKDEMARVDNLDDYVVGTVALCSDSRLPSPCDRNCTA